MPPTKDLKHKFFLRRLFIAIGALLIVGVYMLANLYMENRRKSVDVSWGVTFSTKYSKELGLDWKKVYIATLDELGVRRFRIPVYWDEIRPTDGDYNFSDVDWMLSEAQKRNAKILLVVGRRVPRWPECHTPKWISEQGMAVEERELLKLVAAEVEYFKNAPALEAWQLENEPLLNLFGVCPQGNPRLLGEERRVLKEIDTTHPVVITDSGELSIWLPTALKADVLGISMYRSSWNKWMGYFYYPVTPAFYWKKAEALFPIIKKLIVTELQAEPWPSNQRSITSTPIEEQYISMNIKTFYNNIDFAQRVGFPDVYLWGVEWWYWIKEKGNPDFWNAAQSLFMKSNSGTKN